MSKTVTVTADVRIPRVPNFLLYDDDQKLPLDAVSEEDLRRIGAAWTEALVERSRQMAGERRDG